MTQELLEETGLLSIHQVSFMSTVSTLHRAIITIKPRWFISQIVNLPATRTQPPFIQPLRYKLNIRSDSMLVKEIPAYNLLLSEIKELEGHKFKRDLKRWTRQNIQIKPT